MKKLMIAAAIVCAAVVSQAATCSWGSGNIYLPTSTGAKGSTLADFQVKGTLWEVTAETYASYTSATAIYDAYKAGDLGAYTATDTDFMGDITLQGTKNWGENDYAYALVVYEYTDIDGTDWYIANRAKSGDTQGTSGINTYELANYEGGSYLGTPQGTAITSWQSVPEPTSGILLLLGVAGLALRRRRA